MTKRAALYLRVSTAEQTTDNQRRELVQAAERRGWEVVEVYEDAGISGAKGRDKRPALDRLHKDATRRRFDVVMAWGIDRIGRSTQQVSTFMDEMAALGVEQYYHQQAIDSSTPSGKAMVQMCAVFAEFEREMIRERVKAGLNRARTQGTKSGRSIGRPKVSDEIGEQVRIALSAGKGVKRVAKDLGLGVGTVIRFRDAVA